MIIFHICTIFVSFVLSIKAFVHMIYTKKLFQLIIDYSWQSAWYNIFLPIWGVAAQSRPDEKMRYLQWAISRLLIKIAINFNGTIFLYRSSISEDLRSDKICVNDIPISIFFWFYDISTNIKRVVQYIEWNDHERSLNIDKTMIIERFLLIKHIITWRFLQQILSDTLKKKSLLIKI